ncbi:hypothetical protein PsYK624_079950 [Phanerochaete sordida]|uniref:Uncharacterized protein n=1 Tax=Phanerochaete sordida TaxID=48140 RepID=A0A9P3GCH5_9APHY|nr:hypothetical protein PsYK624_079950 [Phanerochaete sordida]
MDEDDKWGLTRTQSFQETGPGYGYFHQQSMKPQTLAYYVFAGSPAGLLAWIYGEPIAWTDDYPWTADEDGVVLT